MRIHAIQTGRVRIKASQIVGRGHGLARRLAPLVDKEWSDWLPTDAYAIEHRDGGILVDTGASASLVRLPRSAASPGLGRPHPLRSARRRLRLARECALTGVSAHGKVALAPTTDVSPCKSDAGSAGRRRKNEQGNRSHPPFSSVA